MNQRVNRRPRFGPPSSEASVFQKERQCPSYIPENRHRPLVQPPCLFQHSSEIVRLNRPRGTKRRRLRSFWLPPATPGSQDHISTNNYKTLEINLTHPIKLTQLAIQFLISTNRRGKVLLVSSTIHQIPLSVKSCNLPLHALLRPTLHSTFRSVRAGYSEDCGKLYSASGRRNPIVDNRIEGVGGGDRAGVDGPPPPHSGGYVDNGE